MKPEPQTNYVRRGFGLALGVAPPVLLLASLLHGLSGHNQFRTAGLVTELLAVLVGGLNCYLSFVRGALYRRRTGSLDGFRHVSGVPMLGSLLAVIGVLFGFGAIVPAIVGLAAVAADTGGSLWFLIATWRDSSLWDDTSLRGR